MSQKAANPSVNTIPEVFGHIDAPKAQKVRESYYKAIEGLAALAEALEIADLNVGESNDHALIHEHMLACEALQVLEQSVLGAVL